MSLRILIADDESPARARLRGLVEELGHEVCAEAADGLAVERLLRDVHPDAMLLDIEMPGTDGLTLARRMEAEHPEVPVVLVTAHAGHAVAAFDADVRDYVLKPVRRERLERALGRLGTGNPTRTSPPPELRVTVGRQIRLVRLDEIDYFSAENGYVMARSAAIGGFVDHSLKDLERKFPNHVLRVHRNCLAVTAAVAGIHTHSPSNHRLLFRDGLSPVPISRRQLARVKSSLCRPGPK
jgi:two-component system, LytTR family, response regulator AlgR